MYTLAVVVYAISGLSLILQQNFGTVKIHNSFSIVVISLLPIINTLVLIETIRIIFALNKLNKER